MTEDPGGPLQSTTNYRYSVQDDLLAVCQGGVFSGANCVGGKERTFRYDSLRRLASATNPESGETLYTYDDAGNLTTKRDGNMISVNTTYDAIQRPLVRSYSDGTTPEVTYTWDLATLNGIGRMNRVANSVSTTDYLEFDAMGRVLKSRQTTNTTPYNFEYQYNLAGGMSLEKYPSLREVRSCYDEAGRISQVKQKANATAPETVVANLTGYAPHGAVTGMTLGPSLVTETTLHDPKRLQVQQLTASTVAAGNWQMNLYYCADESLLCTTNNGNIVRQKGFGGAAWDYSYDSLNRLELTTENVNGTYKWHQRMKYDPFGNRWILNEAGTLIPNLDATPRAQLASDPSPFTTKNQWNGASYDPGGNQTTTWGNGTAIGAAIYSYDAENRIKKAEVNWPVGGAGVVEHGYDGDGRRIWKKVGGVVKTTFVYNAAGQLVAEYGESAAMPCTTCYLTADHLGSTRVVWGSDGAMKQLLDFAPFGEEVGANYRGGDLRYPGGLYPRPGGMGVSMEFTGKERDAETGLDYFGARYMASTQGRFTSPDWSEWPEPIPYASVEDPQTFNLYAYGRNNPLTNRDIDGHFWQELANFWKWGHWVDNAHLEGALQRQADDARKSLAQMQNFTLGGKTPQELAQITNNQQVLSTHRQILESIAAEGLRMCPPGVLCGVAPMIGGRAVFRGGTSLVARPGIDVKVGADGLIRPGRGISVSLDPKGLDRFGGARQVTSMPDELQLVQRGTNANHYEIAPKQPMTLQRFQELLGKVKLKE